MFIKHSRLDTIEWNVYANQDERIADCKEEQICSVGPTKFLALQHSDVSKCI